MSKIFVSRIFKGIWFILFQYIFCSYGGRWCTVAAPFSFHQLSGDRVEIWIWLFWKSNYYTFTMKYDVFWKLHGFRLIYLLTRGYKNEYWNVCRHANFGHLNVQNLRNYNRFHIHFLSTWILWNLLFQRYFHNTNLESTCVRIHHMFY